MTKQTIKAQLGQAVRRVRESAGMTVEELALRAGVDRGNLSKMETGKMGITMAKLFAIAGALGLPASELLRLAETDDEKAALIVGLIISFPPEQKEKLIELIESLRTFSPRSLQ